MALATCVRCEQIFNKVKSPVCPKCEPDEEADFEKVRKWIQENPNQSPEIVAENTEVEVDCVLRLVDAGRISAASMATVECGQCGAPAISATMRLCSACLGKLELEIAEQRAKIKLPPKKGVETDDKDSVRGAIDKKRPRSQEETT